MPDKQTEKQNGNIGSDFDVFEQAVVFENGQQVEEAKTDSQPRDSQGRFVSPTDDKLDEAKRIAGVTDDEPTRTDAPTGVREEQGAEDEFENLPDGVAISRTTKGLRIEIDNPGNPDQKDVYYAKSETEALTKIAVAKMNASKRIAELKTTKATEPAPTEKWSADDEFMLLQELQTAPTKAIRKALEAEMGISLPELKQKVQMADEFTRQQKVWDAAQKFMAANPSYVATPQNGSRIETYIQKMGMDATKIEDLERAYEDLNSSGLLEVSKTATPAQEPTVRTEPKPAPKKAMSGISSRSGSSTVSDPPPGVLSANEEAQLEKMTLEQAREYINGKLRSSR